MSSKNTKQKILKVFRVLVSIALLSYLLFQIDWESFYQVATQFSLVFLLITPLGYYGGIVISAVKWKYILDYYEIRKKFSELFSLVLAGAYYNNFLPSSIGGDGYRFLKLRAEYPSSSDKIFSSLILERVFGYLALIILHFILAIFYWNKIYSESLLLIIEACIILAVIFGALLWANRSFLSKLSERWVIFKKVEEIFTLLEIKQRKTLVQVIILSLLFALLSVFFLALFYWAVGAEFDWFYVFYIATVINIISIVPITINGLGLNELIQVTFLSSESISVETVVAVSLAIRIIYILYSLPGAGLGTLSNMEKSKNEV